MAKRNSLGKGLDALFLDNNTEDGVVTALKISQVEPNKKQPRTVFEDESLRELADSIREHGVIQPLVVRPRENGGYQIVAGERRWRAARMAGLGELPVVIRELDDNQALEVAIIENLQREDLNPIELANGYQALIDQYGMTQEQVAERLGKSRPVVANTIRLLSLPKSVLPHVQSGKISRGQAKALLSLEDTAVIEQIAQRILKEDVLVRDIEKLARELKKDKTTSKNEHSTLTEAREPNWGDNYHKEMEIALSTELGRKVRIARQGRCSVLELEFYNDEELADIAARLTRSNW